VAVPLFLTRVLVRLGLGRLLPAARRWAGRGEALHYYAGRVLAAPLDDMARLADALETAGPGVIDLTMPAPRFDLAPSASTKLPIDRRGYPPVAGLLALREELAARHRAAAGVDVDAVDGVLVTHGAAAAFAAAADAFLDPGTPVVLFDPSSPLFAAVARSRRARVRWVPSWVEEGRTRFHLNHLARAMRRARMLVLADPNNPTGGTLAAEDLEQITWWARRYDVLIYVDRSFGRYRGERVPARPEAFPDAPRRVLTAEGLGPGWGLPAARVGWLVGDRHLVRVCALTASLSAPFVPTVCQQTALAALRQGDHPFRAFREAFADRRRYALGRLRAAGLDPAVPGGGYFLWVPVAPTALDGAAFAAKLLDECDVRVSPGAAFGPGGGGHVRISLAGDEGRLREGLARIGKFVTGGKAKAAPAPAEPVPAGAAD
jgi:aspartate/methionine/tyrosine aminotransferase